MAAPLLQVCDLYCERDERVLFEGLNFQLNAQEILHVCGRNGSGKSSLLRILSGLYQGFEGEVLFNGESLSRVRDAYNASLLYFGHNLAIKSELTAEENLRWYASIQPQLDPARISQALFEVGLQGYEDVLCSNLSAGQKRRVNLARLYLYSKEDITRSIWILDEPFTAIDKDGVSQLERHIETFVSSGGAVLITTHQDMTINQQVSTLNLDSWGT